MNYLHAKMQTKNLRLEDVIQENCYHVCTDGHESPLLLNDKDDYDTARIYLAIAAWKTGVQLVVYCIMSNHIHALVTCDERKQADKFIKLFKKLISFYLNKKYGISKALHGIPDSIILIDSIQYLRNCIAYILRNAISAKVCSRIEDYRWSSYSCYFSKKELGRHISTLGAREIRARFKTRENLSKSPFYIDEKGDIQDSSFIRHDIVERAFGNSGRFFLLALGTCNDAKMEYEMACKPLMRVNDSEIASVAEDLARTKFNGNGLSDLNTKEKCSMIKNLFFNNRTNIPQLSRVLGLSRNLISQILST